MMRPRMVERVFLGWHQPFSGLAADWLLRRPDLPDCLVLVPTSQAARQLKRAMALAAGAMLSPRMMTPGALMRQQGDGVAPDWLERIAWQEVLEASKESDWNALFGEPPESVDHWAGGMAEQLHGLRRNLQESGLMLGDVARRLSGSVEAQRWQALASMENRVEEWLRRAGWQSRSRTLSRDVTLPEGLQRIILAGITELPARIRSKLADAGIPVHCLMAAPESRAGDFCGFGLPLPKWSQEELAIGDNDPLLIHVTADTHEQAVQALRVVAQRATGVEDLALGTADSEVGEGIAAQFTKAGWIAHHPAGIAPCSGLRRWLQHWVKWLDDPTLAVMADLLALPECAALTGRQRGTTAEALGALRDHWVILRTDDLRHRHQHTHEDSRRPPGTAEVIRAMDTLEQWRALCLRRDQPDGLLRLIATIAADQPESHQQAAEICSWLEQARDTIRSLNRPASFWLRLLLSDLETPSLAPPEGRVVDVQGWLELLYQPGGHLVICGLNEGKLPAGQDADPWLGQSARAMLELPTQDSRCARDAFLLHSLIHSRLRSGGHVDLICGRANRKGDPMLPSRLLIAAPLEQLPARVEALFAPIEPADAGVRWHADWQWRTPPLDAPTRLHTTSLRDYLACPLRFLLKHRLRLSRGEPERVEWNAREFGNVIHDLLEMWGKDPVARDLTDPSAIHDWLCLRLDEEVRNQYGPRVPLAVRIQCSSIRQRLAWFSQLQAAHRADGWQVREVEHKFEIPLDGCVISAKIDRIDHREGGKEVMIIDYKTGRDKGAQSSHRTRWTASGKLPLHIQPEDPVLHEVVRGEKLQTYRWTNLQLPMYALAIQQRDQHIATPAYFRIGETHSNVNLDIWDDFDAQDLAAAEQCARWIVGRITAGVFWPPATKVDYDDYEELSCGRPLEQMFVNEVR